MIRHKTTAFLGKKRHRFPPKISPGFREFIFRIFFGGGFPGNFFGNFGENFLGKNPENKICEKSCAGFSRKDDIVFVERRFDIDIAISAGRQGSGNWNAVAFLWQDPQIFAPRDKYQRVKPLLNTIVYVINKFLPLQTRDCLRQWRFFQENKAFQTYTSRLPDREIGFGLPFSTPPYGSWSCFLWFPAPAGFRKMP